MLLIIIFISHEMSTIGYISAFHIDLPSFSPPPVTSIGSGLYPPCIRGLGWSSVYPVDGRPTQHLKIKS